ncbi:hypothetical protein Tco_0256876 [Tanacetum coccineum]
MGRLRLSRTDNLDVGRRFDQREETKYGQREGSSCEEHSQSVLAQSRESDMRAVREALSMETKSKGERREGSSVMKRLGVRNRLRTLTPSSDEMKQKW